MYHDEPSHRPGQDPCAYVPETEAHYGATLHDYQDKLRRLDPESPNAARVKAIYEREAARYQGYLDDLIERKRAEGLPISFDYATDDDVVFREDTPYAQQDGKPYSKREVLMLARESEEIAKLLLEHANRRGVRVLTEVRQAFRAVVMAAAREHAAEHFLAERLRTSFVDEIAERIGRVEALSRAGTPAVQPLRAGSDMAPEPRIEAHFLGQAQTVVELTWLFVPPSMRRRGVGTKLYEDWERSLPPSVQSVRLYAANADGRGHSDRFWEGLGFDWRYTAGAPEDMSTEDAHAMHKGVNGHPTPPLIRLECRGEQDRASGCECSM